MYLTDTDNRYRFWVSDDGTILRGRVYRLPSDWTYDSWQHYWDGDLVAFIVDDSRTGTYAVTENEDTERAITGYRYSGVKALESLAPRITGHPESLFITVHLDRGTDCWALCWSPENADAWRDEIEAVWHGDIWRIEVEEYAPGLGFDGGDWIPADEICEEYYGEDQAEAGFVREFPLDAFPAERLVDATN